MAIMSWMINSRILIMLTSSLILYLIIHITSPSYTHTVVGHESMVSVNFAHRKMSDSVFVNTIFKNINKYSIKVTICHITHKFISFIFMLLKHKILTHCFVSILKMKSLFLLNTKDFFILYSFKELYKFVLFVLPWCFKIMIWLHHILLPFPPPNTPISSLCCFLLCSKGELVLLC